MSLISEKLKKSEKTNEGSMESTPLSPAPPMETSEPRRMTWSGWAGWGVAAVAVLVAGPVVMERWLVKEGVPIATAPAAMNTPPVQLSQTALGQIQAISEPAGAGILMDGRFVGVTPMRFQWIAGPATLTLKKNGFQDLSAPMQVEAAKEVDFRVTLLPETMKLASSVTTAPPPARNGDQADSPAATRSQESDKSDIHASSVEKETTSHSNEGNKPAEKTTTDEANQPAQETITAEAIQPEKATITDDVSEPPAETLVSEGVTPAEELKTDTKPDKPAKVKKSINGKMAKSHEVNNEPVMTAPTEKNINKISPHDALAALLKGPDSTPSDVLNFAYAIQIAAFLDRDSAIRNAALWRKKGYDAYVLELWGIKDPTRLWQSVRVGRFNDLTKAWASLAALRKREGMKGFYVARSDSFTPPNGVAPTQAAKIIPVNSQDHDTDATMHMAKKASDPAPTQNGAVLTSLSPKVEKTPVVAKALDQVVATAPEPVVEKASEPVVAKAPEPVVEKVPEPVVAKAPEPVVKTSPKPIVEKKSEPTVKKAPEPIVAPIPVVAKEPIIEKTMEPVAPSAPSVAKEVVIEKAPEPIVPPAPVVAKFPTTKPIPASQPVSEKFKSVYQPTENLQAGTFPAHQKKVSGTPVEKVEDNWGEAPSRNKAVSVQAAPTVVQTVKEVLPEQSAWNDHEFSAQQPVAKRAINHQDTTPAGAVPAKKLSARNRLAPAPTQDMIKVSSEQAGWAERVYQQSVDKKNEGDRAGEEALLQQVLKVDPGHIRAVRRMARIMVENNRADQALDLLRQAAGGRNDAYLAEEDPNLAAFMAALYQRREEHWQAIDLYDALLKKYPNKGLWQMGMAISLEKVEEPVEAVRAYKKALASGDLNHKLQNFVRKRIEKL
ncbi:MAG: PEGA domain-containing protein [Magnetococcus sp. YQC-5]